jgi:hypothetical protein
MFVAAPSGRVRFDRSGTGITCSKPAQGMYVCPRLLLLSCPLEVQVLRKADDLSKKSFQIAKEIYNLRINYKLEEVTITRP